MLAPVSHGCIPRSLLRTIALLDGTEEASFVGTDTHDSIAVWSITSDFCDRTSSVNEPWTHCDMLPGGLRVLGPVDATTSSWNSMTLDNITDDGDDNPTAFLSSIDYTMLRCSFTTSLSWVPPFSHIADPSYRILQIAPPPSSPPPSHDNLFVMALETFRQTLQDPSRSFFQLPTLSSSCHVILAISGDVVHGKLPSNDTSNGRLSLRDVLPAYHERTYGGGAPYRSSHHPVTMHRALSSSAAGAPVWTAHAPGAQCGASLAFTVVGVASSDQATDMWLLILDPHYCGPDSDVRALQTKVVAMEGYKALPVGWRRASSFSATTFFNLCLPQRPVSVLKATEHFTRFQHGVMHHITEAVNAVRKTRAQLERQLKCVVEARASRGRRTQSSGRLLGHEEDRGAPSSRAAVHSSISTRSRQHGAGVEQELDLHSKRQVNRLKADKRERLATVQRETHVARLVPFPLEHTLVRNNPSTAANSQRVVATRRSMERHVVVQEHEARDVQL
ncbi:hypothetical protein DYB25_005447, partial [Aphanomyces astaci]